MIPRRVQILEIGASHLACGGFTAKSGRLVLEYWDSEPVDPEWTTSLEQFDQLLPKLAAFAKRQPNRASTLLLPGHLVLTKIVLIAPSTTGGGMLLDPAEHIPLALSDVVWGWQELDGGDTSRTALIVAARKNQIERACQVMIEAGLRVDRVVSAATALLASRGVGGPAVAIASSDVRSTLLVATAGTRRLVRTIPIGTRQLEQGRLGQEIERTLTHWAKTLALRTPEILHVCGVEQTEALAAGRPFRVERYEVDAEIASAGGATVPKSLRPEMSGAARALFLHGQSPIDLSPDSLVRERVARKRSRMRFAAAALVVLALLPPLLFHRRHASEALRRAQAVERDLRSVTSLQSANVARLRELEQLRVRTQALSPAYAARDSWRRFFSELQECVAEVGDAWVERLQLVPNGRSPKSEGRRLVLAGQLLPLDAVPAPERARQFLRRLAATTFVSGLEGERFENAADGALKFTVTLVLKPESAL